MTLLERLEPHLQTAETLAADTLTTAGIPAGYAPLVLILGGLAALLWLLSTTGGGGTASHARPPSRGVAVSGGGGGVSTLPRSGKARDDRGATGDPTPRGVGVGAGRMDTKDDGADWAADEEATLEHSGGFAFKEPPPRGWLVPDLVPHGPVPVWRWYWRRPTRQRPLIDREVKGYTTVVIGAGGTGKSYLLADVAMAALTGGTWLGKPVQRVKNVLYVDCELDAQTFWTRAFAVARGRWLEDGKPPKGLHYLRLKASLASWAGQQQIRDAVRKSKADLILVDSLTIGAHGLALADSNGWRRVYAGFERWGKPVVAIDHLGKEAGRGAVGSFMKQAMVRSALTMERERGGNIKVEHSKTNFGPQVEAFRVVSSFTGGTSKDDPLTVSFTAAEQTGASLVGGPTKPISIDRPVAATAGTEKHPTVSAKGVPLLCPVLPVEQSTPPVKHRPLPLPVLTPRGNEVRAYTAPSEGPPESKPNPDPRTLAPQGHLPQTSGSDPEPSARTHSVAPPILPPRESNAVVSREARPAGALPLNHGAHGDATQSLAPPIPHRVSNPEPPAPMSVALPLSYGGRTAPLGLAPVRAAQSVPPLPLPVLTPPVAGHATPADTAAPVLAWLRAQPLGEAPIPSRDIYAAMGAQGVTRRSCKVQLKALYEAGKVERSGQASKGYRYRVPGSTPTP